MDETKATELNTLLKRLLDEAEGASPPAEGGESESPPPPAVPFSPSAADPTKPVGTSPSEGMPPPGLLANPALLSALPTLVENIGPLLGTLSGGGVGSAPGATRPHTIDRHTALLCAIKPYLSPGRREAAENVIRLCRVWDALERSGISLTGLLGLVGNRESDREGGDPRVQ